MLYDTFMLISAGVKPMSEGLELLDLIVDKDEDRLVPLKEISRQISGVTVHISEEDELAKKWKKKFKSFAESMWTSHGSDYFKSDDTEDPLSDDFQERLRTVFAVQLACAYGVEACVEAATSKFTAYKNSNTPLKSEFKSTILNTVMARDLDEHPETREEWDFIWRKFLSSDSASEQQVLYYSLGLIQDSAMLYNFSSLCMDNTLVRPSDALYILGRSITQTKLGRQVSWKFMKDKWSRLTEEFTDALFAVDAYIAGVLSDFADADTLKEITDFFSPQLDTLGPGRASYESALQSIKGNIAWLEKHKSAVEDSVKDVTLD